MPIKKFKSTKQVHIHMNTHLNEQNVMLKKTSIHVYRHLTWARAITIKIYRTSTLTYNNQHKP